VHDDADRFLERCRGATGGLGVGHFRRRMMKLETRGLPGGSRVSGGHDGENGEVCGVWCSVNCSPEFTEADGGFGFGTFSSLWGTLGQDNMSVTFVRSRGVEEDQARAQGSP
jgi:hypothetical protein